MLLPYSVDVPHNTRPFCNWLLVASIVTAFVLQQGVEESQFYALLLNGWNFKGAFSHMWLHADIWHLVGNMIFLWLFGNAVCAKVGNVAYLPLYLSVGLFSAMSHLLFCGSPALGASGAINGIVGMYLVFYPLNDVSMFYWWWYRIGTFHLSGFWVILMWFIFDVYGAVSGSEGIAYWAHIGGFLSGVAVAVILLVLKSVFNFKDERSLLDVMGINLAGALPQTQEQVKGSSLGRYHEHLMKQVDKDFESHEAQERKKAQRTISIPVHDVNVPITPSPQPSKNDGFVRFECICGRRLKMQAHHAGRSCRCPECETKLIVPTLSE